MDGGGRLWLVPRAALQSEKHVIQLERIRMSHQPTRPQIASVPFVKRTNSRIRATLYLPADVLDEARNATVFLAGYPARMTLAKLAESAFRAEIQRLQDLYNHGAPFPHRDEELKGGRPIAA